MLWILMLLLIPVTYYLLNAYYVPTLLPTQYDDERKIEMEGNVLLTKLEV
jgi:hypothetical protein